MPFDGVQKNWETKSPKRDKTDDVSIALVAILHVCLEEFVRLLL